jgi:flagellar hook-length control protein FliK
MMSPPIELPPPTPSAELPPAAARARPDAESFDVHLQRAAPPREDGSETSASPGATSAAADGPESASAAPVADDPLHASADEDAGDAEESETDAAAEAVPPTAAPAVAAGGCVVLCYAADPPLVIAAGQPATKLVPAADAIAAPTEATGRPEAANDTPAVAADAIAEEIIDELSGAVSVATETTAGPVRAAASSQSQASAEIGGEVSVEGLPGSTADISAAVPAEADSGADVASSRRELVSSGSADSDARGGDFETGMVVLGAAAATTDGPVADAPQREVVASDVALHDDVAGLRESFAEGADATRVSDGETFDASTLTRVDGRRLDVSPAEHALPAPELTATEHFRLIDRVARALATAVERDGTVRLRLHPPELGQLRIEVAIEGGGLVARVEAERTHTRSLLLEGLPALRERLAELHLRLERFDVESPGAQLGGTAQRPYDGGRQSGQEFAAPPRTLGELNEEMVRMPASAWWQTDTQIDVVV